MTADQEFEILHQSKYKAFLEEFEAGSKKARSIPAFIDHFRRQLNCDHPTTSFVNYYIKEVIYIFYHEYDLGSSLEEIIDQVIELRKTHLEKSVEHPTQYERPSKGFNLDIEDRRAILEFLANHFATSRFISFLEKKEEAMANICVASTHIDNDKNPEDALIQKPTNAQKLLALYYLQKINQFPRTEDILPLTEFISFLTGNSQKNTYDQFREIEDYKKTRKNLLAVRKQFFRLGLDEVVKMIDEDMKHCWK
jgi:hypothetical protein